ncbi:hypothetical protein BC936DRAFT_147625 [Jimgerdemannia flammicorona]|uniref:Uncharacterized protein n=1 Tax=Jimgerdemannia flammicorona TaxID=994334 RepID=A0A433D4Y1_9FUNG|nr:hypothetical protein BC936DRAFT_147625 [Jimgerdemannia flammicorona]
MYYRLLSSHWYISRGQTHPRRDTRQRDCEPPQQDQGGARARLGGGKIGAGQEGPTPEPAGGVQQGGLEVESAVMDGEMVCLESHITRSVFPNSISFRTVFRGSWWMNVLAGGGGETGRAEAEGEEAGG